MPDQEPSLIQQRMALDRARSRAILGGVLFVLISVFWVVKVVDHGAGATWFEWSGLVLAALVFGAFVVDFARALRKIAAFEARHGRDAGRQRPVSGT